MNNMEPNEELLSAYFDGELDGDAREQVEERLQTDAEFRRCFYDFRAIRDSIQQLPQFKPSPGFSAHVLEEIQAKSRGQRDASKLSNEAASKDSTAHAANASSTKPVRSTHETSRRRWLPWGIGTLAASLFVGLILPALLSGPGDVAMAPKGIQLKSRAAASGNVAPDREAAPESEAAPEFGAVADLDGFTEADGMAEGMFAESTSALESTSSLDSAGDANEANEANDAYEAREALAFPGDAPPIDPPDSPSAISAPIASADLQAAPQNERLGRRHQRLSTGNVPPDDVHASRRSALAVESGGIERKTLAESATVSSRTQAPDIQTANAQAPNTQTRKRQAQALSFFKNSSEQQSADDLDVTLEAVDFQADSNGYSEEQLLGLLNSEVMQSQFANDQSPSRVRSNQWTRTETLDPEQAAYRLASRFETQPVTARKTGRNDDESRSRQQQLASKDARLPTKEPTNGIGDLIQDHNAESVHNASALEQLDVTNQRYVVVTATVEAAEALFHNLDPIAKSQVGLVPVSARGKELQTDYFATVTNAANGSVSFARDIASGGRAANGSTSKNEGPTVESTDTRRGLGVRLKKTTNGNTELGRAIKANQLDSAKTDNDPNAPSFDGRGLDAPLDKTNHRTAQAIVSKDVADESITEESVIGRDNATEKEGVTGKGVAGEQKTDSTVPRNAESFELSLVQLNELARNGELVRILFVFPEKTPSEIEPDETNAPSLESR